MNITAFTKKDDDPIQTSLPRGRGLLLAMLCCCSLLLVWSRPLSAATLIVTNLADSGPGTLRQTVAIASNGDIIKFAVDGEISLFSNLVVNKSLQIFGPGETNLLLNHSFIEVTNATVLISDLTMSNTFRGGSFQAFFGGAIFNAGNLTMIRCLVTDCGVEFGFGGGIFNAGNLTLTQCTVSNCVAEDGGGIADGGIGRLFLDRSTIVSNRVFPVSGGNSSGGGIFKFNGGVLLVTNSTISGNVNFQGDGGGLWINCYTRIESSTVVSNSANGIEPNTGRGGGVFVASPNGRLEIHNTLIANNSANLLVPPGVFIHIGPDIFGLVTSQGWNLIGNPTNAVISGVLTGNIIGVDPKLGPLQDNGGPTPTHALLTGSPAIDHGSPFPGSFPSGDQRDVPRPQDGNGDLRFITDIGAYEKETVIPGTIPGDFIVTSLGDSGPGTLRQALLMAANSNRITFAVTGTIFLTSGPLTVNRNVLLEGPGETNLLIDGQKTGPIFLIPIGTTAQIFDLTVTNGENDVEGVQGVVGGGINNAGNLTLNRVTVTSCTAAQSLGGGIFNTSNLKLVQTTVTNNFAVVGGGIADAGTGQLILDRSAIVGNIAAASESASGGGIEKFAGILLATNSTIADNVCGNGDGGGIQASCYIRMESCTVVSNTASGNQFGPNSFSGRGGGLFLFSPNGVAEIHNTLIADNNAITQSTGVPIFHFGPDVFGRIQSQGWNLIGNPTNATIAGVLTGNLIGVNPLIGPLQNNGGPTPTHALLFGSPAIDAGSPFPGSFPNTDQRGLFIRPQDGNGDNIFITDIGAYEAPTVIPGLVLDEFDH